MSSKKAPKPTAEQVQIQKQQLIQLTQLDEEENRRRKLLLSNSGGVRAFKGSALTRGTPSNTAGVSRVAAFAPPSGGSVAGGATPSSGGRRVFSARSVIP